MNITVKKKGIFSLTYLITLIVGVLLVLRFGFPLSLFFLFALPVALSVSIFEDRTYLIFSFLLGLAALFVAYELHPLNILFDLEFLIGSLISLIIVSEIILSLVTRNKKIIEELAESERQFKRLLNYTYDWEYWIKPDRTIGYSSPSCFQQTGYSAEEFKRDKNLLLEIVHPEDRKIVEEHLNNLRNPKAEKLQFRIITKKGKIRLIRHTCQPVYDDEDIFVGRRATNRNATDRWRAEQALAESEKKYRNIFENLLDVYYRTSLDGTIEIVSPSIEKVSGYKLKEVIGKNVELFYKDKEERKRFVEKIMKEKRLIDYEVAFLDKNGQTRILSFNNKLIFDEKGKPIAIEGIFRDVTEKKQRERELQLARNVAEKYLQVANVMIVILDRNANIKLVNDKAAEILGWPKEKLIGMNWYENFVPVSRRETSRKNLFEDIEKNEVLKSVYESDLIDAKGNVKIILWNTVLIRDESGEVGEILSTGVDITKMKELQKELHEEKEKYKALFESNLAGVFLSTFDGVILECNRALANIFGFSSPEELKELNAIEFYKSPSDRAKFMREIRKERKLLLNETLMKKKNGEEFWVLENVMLLDNNILLGTIIDITERKKVELELKESEKKLRELNELKDKFFSIISHDIRSPFTSLLGYIQLIEDEILPDVEGELGIYLPNMFSSIRNIYDFIEKLLQWSRAQTNRIEMNPAELILTNEVESAYFVLKGNAQYKEIDILNEIDADILVFADELILRTILRNLISNAIKFTPRKGKIRIFANESDDGDNVEIHIEDSGVGMSREILDKLFRLDTQVQTRGTEKEAGSGLGLLLVKELVEKSGGSIWVKSKVGEGSCFSFSLPKK